MIFIILVIGLYLVGGWKAVLTGMGVLVFLALLSDD